MRYRRSNLSSGITAFLAFALLPLALAGQQTGQLTGRVVNADGLPLADVQISLENTSLGTLSNEDGRFLLINVPAGIYQVNAQMIGYGSRSVTNIRVEAGGQAVVDFTMTTQVLTMEELVVTGTVDPIEGVKIPFTVGRISTENMAVPTTHSALASLQGKVAGVSIVRDSGQPGSGVNILLRTPTSIERSNTPMFVVDGVILSSTIGGTTVDLESLDIESVEVVKGAAAASLYGSRAAAGVIQITTKRGSNLALDQTQLKYRFEYGTNQLPTRIPVSNRHHYLQSSNGDWLDESGGVVARDNRQIDPDNFMDNDYQTQLYDNFDAIFVPDRIMLNTFSVAKNSQSTNFMASYTNYDERGNIPGNEGFGRNSFRLNVDHRIGDDFTISASAFHSRSRQDDLDSNPFWDLLITFEPDIDLSAKDENGDYVHVPDSLIQSVNPLWEESQTEDYDNRTRTLISGDLRWRPLQGLSVNGNISYDKGNRFNEYYGPKGLPLAPWEEEPGPTADGYFDHYHYQTQTMNGYVGATYTKGFGSLTMRPTVRAVMEREEYEYTGAWVDGLAISDVRDMDVGVEQNVESSWQEIRASGYLAQMGLDWDGKYILDGLYRYDGSSLFGEDARWNSYYRIAGSYRMAQEDWWPFDFINEFKLRYAIGTAGGRPGFSNQYELWNVNVSPGGEVTVSKGSLGNTNLKPEFTTEQDMGVDMIFNNKYTLQLSYITQTTEDLLIGIPLPAVTGYGNQIQNVGTQSGNTWEATFQAQVINTPDLSWSMDFVADRSRSTIDDWPRSCYWDDLRYICGDSGLGTMWGESLYRNLNDLPDHLPQDQFQVNDDGYVVWVGQGNDYKEGTSKDLWGNATYTDDLGVLYKWGLPVLVRDSIGLTTDNQIGRSEPSLGFGWMNNLRWKSLGAHIHFQGQLGGDIYSGSQQRMHQHIRHQAMDQTGKAEGNKKPIDYYQYLYNENDYTDHWVRDASYLKIRTLQLTYTFGPDILEKLRIGGRSGGISQIDLGFIGRNLYTFTGYEGWDPESGSVLNRYEGPSSYPKMRQLTGYVEVTF